MKIQSIRFINRLVITIIIIAHSKAFCQTFTVKEYTSVLRKAGVDPITLVHGAIQTHDLLIFDDAIHSAKEPFDFYIRILKDTSFSSKINFAFIEVFSIASQSALDKYLNDSIKNNTTLLTVFQDDFSGFGWRYQTYLDLLETVWDINRRRNVNNKLRVIGVDQPIYWQAIHTREQYDVFSESLVARDYFMYSIILKYMDNFKSGKKGIFLTNTRHAYTNLKDSEGHLFWSCATFFRQWHPNKSLSVRIHNYSLFVGQKAASEKQTIAGMEQYKYRWVKMDGGKWDEALNQIGKPVGIFLKSNAFGKTPYVGNLMHSSAKNQTMNDAYDAILFTNPIDDLHFSASTDFFYTPEFKRELKRRLNIIYDPSEIKTMWEQEEVSSIEEFIDLLSRPEPVKPLKF